MRSRPKTRKLESEELFPYAVKILSMRAYSIIELRQKLRTRALMADAVEPVIDRLLEIGYLDEKRFADSYAAARAESDGFGRERVLRDLRGRRVDSELAESAVAQVFEGKTESEMIEAFIERRMPGIGLQGPDREENDKKMGSAYRKLRRAGFSTGGIITALKKRATHPELLDEAPPEDEDL